MSSLLSPITPEKEYNICLVGSGGVGTIAAVVLEKSGRARVTAVLRSNFDVVNDHGWDIESVDHGRLKNWKPSRGESKFKSLYQRGETHVEPLLTFHRFKWCRTSKMQFSVHLSQPSSAPSRSPLVLQLRTNQPRNDMTTSSYAPNNSRTNTASQLQSHHSSHLASLP